MTVKVTWCSFVWSTPDLPRDVLIHERYTGQDFPNVETSQVFTSNTCVQDEHACSDRVLNLVLGRANYTPKILLVCIVISF